MEVNSPVLLAFNFRFQRLPDLPMQAIATEVYKRDLKKFFNKKNLKYHKAETKNSNISIFAGIYESKTTSDSSTRSINGTYKYFDRYSIDLVRNDSFPAFTDTGSLQYKTATKNQFVPFPFN